MVAGRLSKSVPPGTPRRCTLSPASRQETIPLVPRDDARFERWAARLDRHPRHAQHPPREPVLSPVCFSPSAADLGSTNRSRPSPDQPRTGKCHTCTTKNAARRQPENQRRLPTRSNHSHECADRFTPTSIPNSDSFGRLKIGNSARWRSRSTTNSHRRGSQPVGDVGNGEVEQVLETAKVNADRYSPGMNRWALYLILRYLLFVALRDGNELLL